MGLGGSRILGVAQGRQPPGLPDRVRSMSSPLPWAAERLGWGARRTLRRGDLPRAHAAILPPLTRSQNGLPDQLRGPSGASVQAEETRPFLSFSSRRHPASGVPAQAALPGLPRRVSPRAPGTFVGPGRPGTRGVRPAEESLSAPRVSAPDQALGSHCLPSLPPGRRRSGRAFSQPRLATARYSGFGQTSEARILPASRCAQPASAPRPARRDRVAEHKLAGVFLKPSPTWGCVKAR